MWHHCACGALLVLATALAELQADALSTTALAELQADALSTSRCTPDGTLACSPSTTDGHPGGDVIKSCTTCFGASAPASATTAFETYDPDWKAAGAFSCPDGVTPNGVYCASSSQTGKCFSWAAQHIYKASLMECYTEASTSYCTKAAVMMAGQGGDTAADISATKKGVLLLMKRVVCQTTSANETCDTFKQSLCVSLNAEAFSSQWGAENTNAEKLVAAKAATTIMRKSRTCDAVTAHVPADSSGVACSTANPCAVTGSSTTCLGADNAPGSGSCNTFCPVSGAKYRADLGGCVADFCKCPTDDACADSYFKGANGCPSNCPAKYLLNEGYNNTMNLPAGNKCSNANVEAGARTKTKLF